MGRKQRIRLITTLFVILFAVAFPVSQQIPSLEQNSTKQPTAKTASIRAKLGKLAVKGRAPKTGYSRDQFGSGWREANGCDTRNIILARDMKNERVSSECNVLSGELNDPYTGKIIEFKRGSGTSSKVQIDHVVALSDSWQTGAQQLSFPRREDLANDPLNLLAVDGPANQQKSDGDAATWLPSNKPFRCQYVTRQVDVKSKYKLWVTAPEKSAIERVLSAC